MSTIRPLATIAILAGLGIFLAQQINEPQEQADHLTADWSEAPAYQTVAAEAASAVAPPPLESPTLPASSTPAVPAIPAAPAIEAAPPAMAAAPTTPGMPPLPVLPPAEGPSMPGPPPVRSPGLAPPAVSAAAPPALTDDIPMPDNIAEANFGGLPAGPTEPMAASPAPPVPGAPAASNADPYQSYAPPANTNAAPAYPGMEPSYSPLGSIAPEATESATAATGFQDALPAINQALDRNELTRAHALLSSWYGDPSLSELEKAKVEELLSQLAGTVVYSTEHRLEPAYTVKPGDTLKTIGQQYGVPWRLLAKINGIPSAEAIQVGQTLKVIRGPFGAVVDAQNNELVLMIDGKYAGKFPVQLSGAAQAEGQWRVTQKPSGTPAVYGSATGKQLVLADASGGTTVVIAAGAGSPAEQGRVAVAQNDLEELHDILSVGSEVTIRK